MLFYNHHILLWYSGGRDHAIWPPYETSPVNPRNILRKASFCLDAIQNGQDHDLLKGNDYSLHTCTVKFTTIHTIGKELVTVRDGLIAIGNSNSNSNRWRVRFRCNNNSESNRSRKNESIVIVMDGQVGDNRLLLLYCTILFSLDYSHQFNLCHKSQKICFINKLIFCQFFICLNSKLYITWWLVLVLLTPTVYYAHSKHTMCLYWTNIATKLTDLFT